MRYRKIVPRLWGDERFQRLSHPQPNGQTLWLYLLTGPHTTVIPGLFAAGEAGLSEALGWPLPDFRTAWREIQGAGMARADWRARVVWIPKALTYNEPESPNVVKSWAVQMRELPECKLTSEAAESLSTYLEAKGKAWTEAFREAFREASPKAFGESGAVAVAVTVTGAGAGDSPPNPPLARPATRSNNGRQTARKHVNAAWSEPAKEPSP